MTVAPTPHLRWAGLILTIFGLVAISFATLLPEHAERADAVRSVFCVVCGSVGGINAVLNVFLFVPLGVGLAFYGFSWKRALGAFFVLSILIETAQFMVIAGRYSTIGDVLTNTLGGALGFVIGRHMSVLLRPSPRNALALSVAWSAVWLAIQTVAAFGFSPVIPSSEYYGQIARRLENFEQFRGRVVRASIGDVTVPDSRFVDSRSVRELLLRGATVTATIVPATPTRGIAPIVRVADPTQSEVMLLAQDADNLIFGVRTGAGVLRLRPPVFTLPDPLLAASADDGGPTTDTVILSASYAAHNVWVNAQTARANYGRRIQITASLGWTMVMPFQWYIQGTRTESVISAIWIAGLLLPLGYWGASTRSALRTPDSTRFRITVVALVLAVLYAGLVGVPQVFGLTAAPASDWLAALTGVLLGATLALRTQSRDQKVVHPD